MYIWKLKGEECLFIYKMYVWGKGENEVGEGGGVRNFVFCLMFLLWIILYGWEMILEWIVKYLLCELSVY